MRTFFITSHHDIFVDNYNDGEEPNSINSYSISETVKADNWRLAVNEYFKRIGFNLGMENCEIYDNFLETSCLVDGANMQPNETQVKQWQNGNKTLYANHISIGVQELITIHLI